MDWRDRTSERLVALFLLGALLLLPPALLLFNRPVRVLGVPVLYLYVFIVWGLIIALAAALAGRIDPEPPAGPAPEPGGDSGRRAGDA